MKKTTFALTSLFFLSGLAAYSQNDTSYLDLGRVKLKKEFTQTISIKGEDLEKMPFSNLSEALNVWLYGFYSNLTTLTYVIDGNIGGDVNTLSIYDIEEVTLVQNALTQVNGAVRNQQLVLIKTRRHLQEPSGITASAQSSVITQDTKSAALEGKGKSQTGFYHQLYFAAWKNKDFLQYGISANFLHDANPYLRDDSIIEKVTAHFNRYRLNGWFNIQLTENTSLEGRVNYTNEFYRDEAEDIVGNGVIKYLNDDKLKEPVFNSTISIHTGIDNKWENDLNASFITSSNHEKAVFTVGYMGTNPGAIYNIFHTNMVNMLVRDQLSYHAIWNNWHIDPSLNASFRYLNIDHLSEHDLYPTISSPPSIAKFFSNYSNLRIYLLTPSIDLSYKNIFNLQSGVLINLTTMHRNESKRPLPFASLTADVLKLFAHESDNSVKIYLSASKGENLGDVNYMATDFSSTNSVFYYPYNTALYGNNYLTGGNGGAIRFLYYRAPFFFLDSINWSAQAGIKLNLMHKRLRVSYHFERRVFNAELSYAIHDTSYSPPFEFYSSTHHLSIEARLADQDKFKWLTGINCTIIRDKEDPAVPVVSTNDFRMGDYYNTPASFTGGWVNRFSYKQLFWGFDFLYNINETIAVDYNTFATYNSWRLQNLYAGCTIPDNNGHKYEFYISCRNLFTNKNADFPERRKFFGVGIKLGIN